MKELQNPLPARQTYLFVYRYDKHVQDLASLCERRAGAEKLDMIVEYIIVNMPNAEVVIEYVSNMYEFENVLLGHAYKQPITCSNIHAASLMLYIDRLKSGILMGQAYDETGELSLLGWP